MTPVQDVQCPYCGESFQTRIDLCAGSQEYVEDCYVCCQPIVFHLEVDVNGNLVRLEVRRENG
jgi:hypothetical protein